jgi:alkylated DNA repair protein (DNA oxidative demethylase)
MTQQSLLDSSARAGTVEVLGPGARVLRGFVRGREQVLIDAIERIAAHAPFRHLITPGGHRMSVAMTNCGEVGWISDRNGYRYGAVDPQTHANWPEFPACFLHLAEQAARQSGYDAFRPDACLINRYEPGTRLTLHRDYDERDARAPIVSVSIGVPATFLWGGRRRQDRQRRVLLESGDVVVWGGESRFVYHGIATLKQQYHPLTGSLRYNLTFRKAR